MKNILSGAWLILAVLFVSSCDVRTEIDDPKAGTTETDDPKAEAGLRFEIQVDSVEATTAHVTVCPSDTIQTYYWNVFVATSVAGMPDDSLRSEMEKDMDEWLRTFLFEGYNISYAHLLSRGDVSYPYVDLAANTDYAVLAVKMNDEGLASGPVAKKYFSTLPVEEDSAVVISTGTAKLHDQTKTKGFFMLTTSDGDLDISISVFSQSLLGTFTSADMDQKASYITDWSKFKSLDMVELEFTGKPEDGNYVYEGWFITVDKVKYRFRFLCSL